MTSSRQLSTVTCLRAVWCLFVLLVFPLAALAQEQTVVITGPSGVLTASQLAHLDGPKIAGPSGAKALITGTLGAGVLDRGGSVVVHVLKWNDDGTLDKHNWYVYHDGVNSQEEFTGLRIYGRHNVSLLYIHLNAKGSTEQEVKRYSAVTEEFNDLFQRFLSPTARSGPKAELLKCFLADPAVLAGSRDDAQKKCAAAYTTTPPPPDNDASLAEQRDKFVTANPVRIASRALLQPNVQRGAKCTGITIGGEETVGLDHYCVAASYLRVGYRVVATPKLPAAIADLAKLIQPQAGQRSDQLQVESLALWGGEAMTIVPVPSDLKITSIRNDTQLDSRTFDNEGRYFWDISVALPLRSIKDTQYDPVGQSFTAKKVDRQGLYAVFNIFPQRIDTKSSGNSRLTPSLLIGTGIEKRPLDRLLFAGGLGIGKVQFFVGTAMTKKQFLNPDGTLGDGVYRTNMIFGLNVPLRQVLGTLKAAK